MLSGKFNSEENSEFLRTAERGNKTTATLERKMWLGRRAGCGLENRRDPGRRRVRVGWG